MGWRRFEVGLAVVAAAVVFPTAIYVVRHQDPVPDAGQTPGYSVAPAPTPSGAPPKIAFLGDEYTAGTGASEPSKRFTAVVAADLKVREVNVAVPRGGYARPGIAGQTYISLIPAAAAAQPQLLVVTGGRNDYPDDPATLSAAVTAFFQALRSALPATSIVVLAPFWGDSPLPPQMTALTTMIKIASTAVGATFLALPDPLQGHPGWMVDSADPNDAGYAALAKALAPALQRYVSGTA